MILGNQQTHANITEIQNTPNSDLNIITYSYNDEGVSFTETYTQNKQQDPASYSINDTIPVIYSTLSPSVKMTQAAYEASGTDAKIFISCITAILLLLGLSFLP